MQFSVRKYQKSDFEIWEKFVVKSNNGTLFQKRNFLNYHLQRSFVDNSLIIEKSGKIFSVFPAVQLDNKGERVLFSHPGASFGGFVCHRTTHADAEQMVEAFEMHCFHNNIDRVVFTPSPPIYCVDHDDTLEYVLLWKKYSVQETYLSSIIPTGDNKEKLLQKVCKGKKRSLKFFNNLIQDNNISFIWENHFQDYYPILLSNKKRHNSTPTHTLEELVKLNQLLPGEIHLLMAYSNEKPIGGTLILVANKNVGIIFYNMIDYQYKHLQPAVLQIMETVSWAKKRGINNLDFGVSQDPRAKNPLTPSPSLIRFKEEFGGTGMIRKIFSKKINQH